MRLPKFVQRRLDEIALRLSTYWHVSKLESLLAGTKDDYHRYVNTIHEPAIGRTVVALRTAFLETMGHYEARRYEQARACAIAAYTRY